MSGHRCIDLPANRSADAGTSLLCPFRRRVRPRLRRERWWPWEASWSAALWSWGTGALLGQRLVAPGRRRPWPQGPYSRPLRAPGSGPSVFLASAGNASQHATGLPGAPTGRATRSAVPTIAHLAAKACGVWPKEAVAAGGGPDLPGWRPWVRSLPWPSEERCGRSPAARAGTRRHRRGRPSLRVRLAPPPLRRGPTTRMPSCGRCHRPGVWWRWAHRSPWGCADPAALKIVPSSYSGSVLPDEIDRRRIVRIQTR